MRLLLMRHASAVRGGPYADADRPLLAEGELQAEWAGRAFRRLAVAPSRLWTSPALRCRRTAEIVASHLEVEAAPLEVQDALSVGRGGAPILETLQQMLRQPTRRERGGLLLAVGHQPDLEELVSLLVRGNGARPVTFEPGGCALLRLALAAEGTRARLEWLLTPAWFALVSGV